MRGSHRIYHHPTKPGIVVVAGKPSDDVDKGHMAEHLASGELEQEGQLKLTYAVVFEQMPNNYSAYSPDLDGCIGTAATWEEIQETMREAITIYIEETLEKGGPMPAPHMSVQDALTYHSDTLSENAEALQSTFSESPATVSTTVAMIDVEVAAPTAAG